MPEPITRMTKNAAGVLAVSPPPPPVPARLLRRILETMEIGQPMNLELEYAGMRLRLDLRPLAQRVTDNGMYRGYCTGEGVPQEERSGEGAWLSPIEADIVAYLGTEGCPVGGKRIASRTDQSYTPTFRTIMKNLCERGIVQRVKGPSGGYQLAGGSSREGTGDA